MPPRTVQPLARPAIITNKNFFSHLRIVSTWRGADCQTLFAENFFYLAHFFLDFPAYFLRGAAILHVRIARRLARLFFDRTLGLLHAPFDFVLRARSHTTDSVFLASEDGYLITFAPVDAWSDGYVEQRSVATYVTAALKMRPDLSKEIVIAALPARARNEDGIGYSWMAVSEIVSAAVVAEPEKAPAIARAAITLPASLRQCALAAAISAAPDQRVAIEKAVEASSLSFAFLTFSAIYDDPVSFSVAILNPANVSELREIGGVNSPEQPPLD